MIEAVVSDLGRVLLDFDNALFFERMTRYTKKTAADIRAVVHDNLDLLTLFDMGAITPEAFHRNAAELLEAEVGVEDFYRDYSDVFTLRPAVLDLYRRIRPKCRMVLLSNTDVIRWTYVRRRFPEILIFDGYALSFDLGVMKPQPEIYLEALRTAGTAPDRAVFIDDLAENVSGAARVGMPGIVLGPGVDLEAELRRLGLEV